MNRQILKQITYLEMASSISKLGTCRRLQVGCVLLSQEGRVVGAGYNGAGPGMPHCKPESCGPNNRCLRCAHAEENAVANASDTPYRAYVTHEPCGPCTRKLLQAGVREIFYTKPYTSMPDDERAARQEWLDHFGVRIEFCRMLDRSKDVEQLESDLISEMETSAELKRKLYEVKDNVQMLFGTAKIEEWKDYMGDRVYRGNETSMRAVFVQLFQVLGITHRDIH